MKSQQRLDLSTALASAPPFLVAVLLLLWSSDGGGFSPSVWYPGLLFLEALALTLVVGAPWLFRSQAPLSRLALAALAALALWAVASIAWAQVRGDALDGANRTIMFVLLFGLFAWWRWSERSRGGLLLVLGAGTCVVGLVSLERALTAPDPATFFIGGRVAEPTGYPNATAALYLATFWPMLHLAGDAARSVLLRASSGGMAAFLLQLGLLPQSRGAVYSLPVVTLVYLVAARRRWHRLILMLLLAAATYAASDRIFAVYRSGEGGATLVHSLSHARTAMLAAAAAFAGATAVVALLDGRVAVPGRVAAAATRFAVAVLAVGLVVGAVEYGIHRSAARDASAAWQSFRSGGEPQGTTHLVGLGSNRYDFWRVSLRTLAAHPVGGVGADNFAAPYLRDRRSREEPLYPHSLEMQLASGLGVIGLSLFVLFLLSLSRRLVAGLVRADAAAGVTAAFAYLLVHGSVDWLWDFPALGGMAFAFAGMAATDLHDAAQPAVRFVLSSRISRLALGVAGAGVLAAASLPLFAQIQIDRASRTWRADPAGAVRLLDDAAAVDFVADRPYVIAGSIARRVLSPVDSKQEFAKAVERNPFNWYAWLQLALQEWALGQRRAALAAVERARELNPREYVVNRVAAGMRRGHPPPPQWVDAVLGRRIERLTAPG